MTTDHHLQRMGSAHFTYVDTLVMHRDVSAAVSHFRADLQQNANLMMQAASRLEWKSDNTWTSADTQDMPTPSFPPPVEFVYAR